MPAWIIKYQAKIVEYAIIILICLAGLFAVYNWGKAEGKHQCAESRVVEVIAEAKLSKEASDQISDIAAKAAKILGRIEGNSVAQTKAIEEYVKNNPRFNDCGIDATAIGVWNRENRGETTDLPENPNGKMPSSTRTN